MRSPNDVVLCDRLSAWNQVRIRNASNLQVAWELSRAGSLAFDIPLIDLVKLGLRPMDLLSKWVLYDHPTAGPWGGKVTNVGGGGGIVSVAADSWAIELQGVVTRPSPSTNYPLIGQLMQQIDIVKALTGIRPGTVDVGAGGDVPVTNEPVEVGQDLYGSFIPSVLERWNATKGWQTGLRGAGWNVDPVTRQFSFDASYGTDRTRQVAIRSGRHVATSEYADDLDDLLNTVVVAGNVNYSWTETVWERNDRGKLRPRQVTHTGVKPEVVFANNQPSVWRHGEKATLLRQDHPSTAAMQASAELQARSITFNTQKVLIETVDVEGLWLGFREGDTISVFLGMDGTYGQMVVRSRALDVARGVMTVAGEAVLA